MASSKRIKTKYPGIFYRHAKRIGGNGDERVYYIVFKKDGKVIEEKVGRQYVDDMTPARAAGMRAERIEGKRLSRKEINQQKVDAKKAKTDLWTVNRLWKEYKKNNPGLKGIVTDENRYKNYLKPNFGEKEPKDIIPLDVDRVRLKLLKTKASGTVRNVLELLRRICNFGVKKNLCPTLPFTIEMPVGSKLQTEDLTPKQLESLLKAIEADSNIHAAHMMKMALYTGMRRGEMFKLKWKDINFERGFIALIDPKGGPDQKIPLNDAAREMLKVHPRYKRSPYVFPGRKGRKRTDIKHQVNRIKIAARLPKDFRALHGLRHVYASMLASSGQVDLYTLQKLLTHKSPTMTQRYAHLRDEALHKASALAGSIIEAAMANKDDEKDKVVNLEDRKR